MYGLGPLMIMDLSLDQEEEDCSSAQFLFQHR